MEMLKRIPISQPSGYVAGSSEDHAVNRLRITTRDEGNFPTCIVNNCSLLHDMLAVPWVIDSSATYHICTDLRNFSSYHAL